MKDFRSLIVWEKSHKLTIEVYNLSKKFPKNELYGITSQLQRACSSIPTNIAEGCGRGTDKDFARFLQIAMGSASETEYLIILSADLNYIEKSVASNINQKIQEIKKMLSGLIKSIRN